MCAVVHESGEAVKFAFLIHVLSGDEGTDVQSHTLRSNVLLERERLWQCLVRGQSRGKLSHGKVRRGHVTVQKHPPESCQCLSV